MKYKKIKIAVIIICMLLAGICYSCDRKSSSQGMNLTESDVTLTAEVSEAVNDTMAEETLPVKTCYVHICGEVNSPGVYELDEGERIFRVVELAGGFTANAALDYLNMAEPVRDGMKLVVPSVAELEAGTASVYGDASANTSTSGSTQDSRVNLNTATREQLMTLTGIGQARAEDIIRYREEHGGFKVIEDIMKVPGIKNAAFEKLKADITV